MLKFLRFSVALLLCTGQCLVTCPSVSQAGEGPASGNADASVCGNTLLDRQIAQSIGSFDPTQEPFFKSEMEPIFKVTRQIPRFHERLAAVFKKHWRFGFDGIANCPTENSYDDVGSTKKVACQTPTEVIVNPIWFKSLDKLWCKKQITTDDINELKQKQSDFIVHELLLGITLGTPISVENSARVFAVLVQQPPAKMDDLLNTLELTSFDLHLGVSGPSRTSQTSWTSFIHSHRVEDGINNPVEDKNSASPTNSSAY